MVHELVGLMDNTADLRHVAGIKKEFEQASSALAGCCALQRPLAVIAVSCAEWGGGVVGKLAARVRLTEEFSLGAV